MSHLSCMAMTYTHHCLRWCGFKGSPVGIPIQLTPQVWLIGLLPPDEADFTGLACQCVCSREIWRDAAQYLGFVWLHLASLEQSDCVCVCVVRWWTPSTLQIKILKDKKKKTVLCFVNTTVARSLSEVKQLQLLLWQVVSRNVTYITGKKRTYSSVLLPACVFVFILRSVAAFLSCVLCETERLPENDSLKPDPAVR